jgi:spore germination protein YaaH
VWVEDSAAFVERVGLAERFGVAGIATWRLGQEDPRVWGAVQQWRSTKEE